jgi:hypothetical protein
MAQDLEHLANQCDLCYVLPTLPSWCGGVEAVTDLKTRRESEREKKKSATADQSTRAIKKRYVKHHFDREARERARERDLLP